MESIWWLSSIAFEHDFTICADLFLTKLEAQGHEMLSNVLRDEYFQGMKRGWARAFLPCRSASTNNSRESFNGNALSRDIVGGTRTTMAQQFRDLDGFFKSIEMFSYSAHRPTGRGTKCHGKLSDASPRNGMIRESYCVGYLFRRINASAIPR
jgi:hypothetical protein